MIKIGYARVSTAAADGQQQSLDLQLNALKDEGCKQIFTDTVSGVKATKPNFEKLIEYARSGDTIVVWKLDRLGKSTIKLIELIEELKVKGVNLKSLSESIDTSTKAGNLFFQYMSILAEHERSIIRERTKTGLESARARGRSGGRPEGLSERYRKISPEVKEVYEKNTRSTDEIREMFQIKSQPTLYKILKFAGVDVKGSLRK